MREKVNSKKKLKTEKKEGRKHIRTKKQGRKKANPGFSYKNHPKSHRFGVWGFMGFELDWRPQSFGEDLGEMVADTRGKRAGKTRGKKVRNVWKMEETSP